MLSEEFKEIASSNKNEKRIPNLTDENTDEDNEELIESTTL